MRHQSEPNRSEPVEASREPHPDEERGADTLQRAEDWLRSELARPGVGAIAVGTALVVAAATAGVGETILGAMGAYAVYRMLRRRKAEHAGGR